MKFNLSINQKSIIDNGFELDVIDAVLLDYLFTFSKSEGIISIVENSTVFFWFSHDKIVQDLPILRLKKDSVFRRLKLLCEKGFLIQSKQSQVLGRSFYTLTENAMKAIFQPSDENPTFGRKSEAPETNPKVGKKSEVMVQKPKVRKSIVQPSDENPNDNSIKDNTSLFPLIKKDEGNIEKPKKGKFNPPSVAEVQKYCNERKNNISAFGFVSFYQSKGWKVGNQKMIDWKASVRTWESKNKQNEKSNTNGGTNGSNKIVGKTREFTIDEFVNPSGNSS